MKLNEMFNEVLKEKGPAIDKSAILAYQAKQHKAGNKISWADAEKVFIDAQKAAEKAAKKAAKALIPKAEKPVKGEKEKFISDAQFNKILKGVASDWNSDNEEIEFEDVAWDMAGSLMFYPEVERYARKVLSKNSGKDIEKIGRSAVQTFIADSLVG